MAVHILVTKVDDGAIVGSPPSKEITDRLPFSITLKNDKLTISDLKKLLFVAKAGAMESGVTSIGSGDTLSEVLAAAYSQHA